jgi:uncharacterized membrane protein YgdD (TMEM256/DUF423 family)
MSTESKIFIVIGCVLLAIANALSAFGFHAPPEIMPPEEFQNWFWAVDMQYYFGGGLIVLGILIKVVGPSWPFRIGGMLMIAGLLIFAGLLYVQALTDFQSPTNTIPVGGQMLILSWLAVAIGVIRTKS